MNFLFHTPITSISVIVTLAFAIGNTVNAQVNNTTGRLLPSITYLLLQDEADDIGMPPGGDVEDYVVAWESDFNFPEQDENGFSILVPSADSRLIYVDQDGGNDDTAQLYSPTDSVIGADPQDPVGLIMAYATLAAAYAQTRDNFPDWVMLQRGDTWRDPGLIRLSEGRSISERHVITWYGSNMARPLLEGGVFQYWYTQGNYTALVGLNMYSYSRDPAHDEFVGFDNVGNVKCIDLIGQDGITEGILIEDNVINFYEENSTSRRNIGTGQVRDVIWRRNIVMNNYGTNSHSQGIYSGFASVFLEENIFYHNGWYQQSYNGGKEAGQATIFNHNTYFSNDYNTIFRGNVFLSGASINNKFSTDDAAGGEPLTQNILVDNNFYSEGEVAISLGGNADSDTGPRWANIHVVNNIVEHTGRTQPTDRNLGWGIGVSDWSGGVLQGNIVKHIGDSLITNSYAFSINGHTTNLTINENIAYGFDNTAYSSNWDFADIIGSNANIDFTNNITQNPFNDGQILIEVNNSNFGIFDTVSNNQWFSERGSAWFSTGDYASWVSATGETNSSTQETPFNDPERTLETYMQSLGQMPTIQAFVSNAANESSVNWSGNYTGKTLNRYLRAGFTIDDGM